MLVLMPSDISMNVMTIMNSNMNIIEPPGGVGGGADCPLMPLRGILHRLNVVTMHKGEDLKHTANTRRSWPMMRELGNTRNRCLCEAPLALSANQMR